MQHPTPRRPRRKPGENRERLLAAGVHEFAARGYRGASTAAIAAAAGVPQPHVYTNFSTKHALFIACAERVVETLITLRDGAASGGSGNRRSASAERAEISESRQILSLFVFQATAAVAEEELTADLTPLIARLKTELGTEAFHDLVLQAVGVLT